MVELIVVMAVLGFCGYFFHRIISESEKRDKELIAVSKEFAALAKQAIAQSEGMTKFIDKNINERVVYADPQGGYVNAHKYEPEGEEKDEEDDDVYEMDAESLEEMNKEETKKTEG